MNLNPHYGLAKQLSGTHSFLSPSKPAWVNYDEDKLSRAWYTTQAARRGSELHAFAHTAIQLKRKQVENNDHLNMYINDAIGFGLTSEQLLFFSENCYGHADCVGFRNNTLRVHDLKTGNTDASMAQLKIYAALFCLEYKFSPFDIAIELRIYQKNNVMTLVPDPDEIFHVMEKIKYFDKQINQLKEANS